MAKKLGEPLIALIATPVNCSMIAYVNRMGEHCRTTLRAMRLVTRVLFVALRGLYRSRRAHDPTARPAFRRVRRAAYRQLWAMLENAYWKLRVCHSDASTLRTLLRDVNAFLGKNILYIREADQVLLTRYMLSLQRLRAVICPLVSREPTPWERNAPPTPAPFADIVAVTQEVVDLRNRVLQQMRRMLPSG